MSATAPIQPWSGAARGLIIVAAFVVVVAGMKAASSLVVPFLLAAFIAVVSAPLYFWLQAKRLPAGLALLVLILVFALVAVLGTALVQQSIQGFIADLPRYEERLGDRLAGFRSWIAGFGITFQDELLTQAVDARVALGYLGKFLGGLTGLASQGFLILLIVVFILLEAAKLPAKLRTLPGYAVSGQERMRGVVESVRQYMGLKTLMSLLTGVLVWLWLLFLGVDYPILMGFIAFLLNYIPTIGSIIAAIPGVLLAFIGLDLTATLLTAAGYVVINTVVGNGLEPRIMGKGLGLSALVVLLSMLFWGWVLGPVGMLLSVPLTNIVKIAMDGDPGTRWLAVLLGPEVPRAEEQAPEPTGG